MLQTTLLNKSDIVEGLWVELVKSFASPNVITFPSLVRSAV